MIPRTPPPTTIFAAAAARVIEERTAATDASLGVNRGPDTEPPLKRTLSDRVDFADLANTTGRFDPEPVCGGAQLKRGRWKSTRLCYQSGEFLVADCRITIDDYAVARHPELGIEIAREFDDYPPARSVAYAVGQNDHRGTFYFAQLATAAPKDSKGLAGFHGAGGGGSMMSMDAVVTADSHR